MYLLSQKEQRVVEDCLYAKQYWQPPPLLPRGQCRGECRGHRSDRHIEEVQLCQEHHLIRCSLKAFVQFKHRILVSSIVVKSSFNCFQLRICSEFLPFSVLCALLLFGVSSGKPLCTRWLFEVSVKPNVPRVCSGFWRSLMEMLSFFRYCSSLCWSRTPRGIRSQADYLLPLL